MHGYGRKSCSGDDGRSVRIRDCLTGLRGGRPPESPRWHLRKGQPQAAVDIANRIIERSGARVPPLTVDALGDHQETARDQLPPYWALFRRGQLRWTTVGILSSVCCGTAYFLISVLLPKALVDRGAAVSVGFGLSSLVFFASIPGKAFTGFLMEIIGRRWTIAYALAGSLPGLLLMLMAHWAGDYATVVIVAGALITGFTGPVRLHRSARLPLRTIPDGTARPGAHFWRVGFTTLRRGPSALSDGAAHQLADNLLCYHIGGSGNRRLYPAAVRPGDGRPTGDRHRTGSSVCLNPHHYPAGAQACCHSNGARVPRRLHPRCEATVLVPSPQARPIP